MVKYERCDIEPKVENPWIELTAMRLKTRNKVTAMQVVDDPNKMIVNRKTGEVAKDQQLVMATTQKVDEEEFVKTFAGFAAQFFDLSPKARKVMEVLFEVYRESNTVTTRPDQVGINYELAKDKGYKYKKLTFQSAINELCNREIIAPVKGFGNIYWVNPTVMFKGNRVTYIDHYLISDKESYPAIDADEPKKVESVFKAEEDLFSDTSEAKNDANPLQIEGGE